MIHQSAPSTVLLIRFSGEKCKKSLIVLGHTGEESPPFFRVQFQKYVVQEKYRILPGHQGKTAGLGCP
jgi:hypothetical protein